MEWLYKQSAHLRQLAVDCLEQKRKLLFLQGNEYLKAKELVEAAASQYGISGTEYCALMRQESYWGGGPEIVALCNVLQRPIHVYELHVMTDKELKKHTGGGRRGNNNNNNQIKQFGGDDTRPSSNTRRGDTATATTTSSSFVLRRMACFGSPKFDRYPALHILSADSRFPDVVPGKQQSPGNHFLAMFPEPVTDSTHQQNPQDDEKKQRIRGGGDENRIRGREDDTYDDDDVGAMAWWKRLWRY
jgi:hypothetical protein